MKELAERLPQMEDWIFPVKREVDVHPIHGFRRFVQRAGLMRKHKEDLVLTPAGRRVRADPEALWAHLAEHFIPAKPAFNEDCSVVPLVHLGAGAHDRTDLGPSRRRWVTWGGPTPVGSPSRARMCAARSLPSDSS